MLQTHKHRPAYLRIANQWYIEGGSLFTRSQRIAKTIPTSWIGAFEIHIAIRAIVGMHADVGVAHVDHRLTAIATHRLEQSSRLRSIRKCTVVLRAADEIGLRILRIDRQTLELQGCQPGIQTQYLCWDG